MVFFPDVLERQLKGLAPHSPVVGGSIEQMNPPPPPGAHRRAKDIQRVKGMLSKQNKHTKKARLQSYPN